MTDYFDGIHIRTVSTPGCRCGWTGEDYEGPEALVEAMDERSEHQLVCPDPEVRNRAIALDERRIDPVSVAPGLDDSLPADAVTPAAREGQVVADGSAREDERLGPWAAARTSAPFSPAGCEGHGGILRSGLLAEPGRQIEETPVLK